MARIQVRRDSTANWTSNDPVLNSGEIGYETDSGKFKIGNGSSAWSALSYFIAGAGGGAVNLDDLTDVVLSSPSNGQVLKYDGTNWVNAADETGGGGGGSSPYEYGSGSNDAIQPVAGTNTADGANSVVGGGSNNFCQGANSVVGGGSGNQINNYLNCVIGGGGSNTISNACATIGGGVGNSVTGLAGVIAGGGSGDAGVSHGGNSVVGNYAAILGGFLNIVVGNYSTCGGGQYNNVDGANSVIGGGQSNLITSTSTFCTLSGGKQNKIIDGTNCTVAGGYNNVCHGTNTSILGGTNNSIGDGRTNSHIIGSEITADADNTTFVNNLKITGGGLIIASVPTADPFVVGAVWNDNGTLKISAGPPPE